MAFSIPTLRTSYIVCTNVDQALELEIEIKGQGPEKEHLYVIDLTWMPFEIFNKNLKSEE